MKKIIILSILFINSLFSKELDIYEAFIKAQETNRPIYYIVVSASCEHCYKHLKNTVIPNKELIMKDFIFAITDVTKGQKIPSDLPFDGYTPTTYIVAPNGQLMITPLKGNFDSNFLYNIFEKLYEAYGS